MVEQPGISVDDLVDRIDSEHRLRDQKLEGHVLVESLQRTALRRLEDEVRGHKPRGDGPSAEVVNRLGAMPQRVENPEEVDHDISQMSVAVVDDQVEIDIVGRSKAAARQRAGD